MKYKKLKTLSSRIQKMLQQIFIFSGTCLVKPTSLRKEILMDSSDGNDEYGCNGFSLKKYFSASHDQFLRMIVIIV